MTEAQKQKIKDGSVPSAVVTEIFTPEGVMVCIDWGKDDIEVIGPSGRGSRITTELFHMLVSISN